jgi:uncharacterized damage-inducible protein DinB
MFDAAVEQRTFRGPDMTDDERERRLDQLRAAPRRIAAAVAGVSDDRLNLRTPDEPWSVNDVLAHVRSAADVRDEFIRRLASEERSSIPYKSARSELAKTDYFERSFAENLAAYTTKRAELVAFLESLPLDGWTRGARMRDRPETVASYAGYLADHDAAHCEQIEGLLA